MATTEKPVSVGNFYETLTTLISILSLGVFAISTFVITSTVLNNSNLTRQRMVVVIIFMIFFSSLSCEISLIHELNEDIFVSTQHKIFHNRKIFRSSIIISRRKRQGSAKKKKLFYFRVSHKFLSIFGISFQRFSIDMMWKRKKKDGKELKQAEKSHSFFLLSLLSIFTHHSTVEIDDEDDEDLKRKEEETLISRRG